MAVVRRKLVIGLGASAGAASVVVGLWLGVLPRMVEDRSIEAIRRRTGGDVRIEGASVGVSSVTLRGVAVSVPTGGLDARVSTLRLETGALGWLGGASSVRSVAVDGVQGTW